VLLISSGERLLARSERAARRPARRSDQCLPIGDGDLVIVGMNFAEGEKSVTIPAVVDKGSLQRWFDPCDLG
jgi:hypothetical protein